MYLGDFPTQGTVDFKFLTRNVSTAAPATLTGGTVSIYKGNADGTEVTTGVTLTADFDSRTGLNHVRVLQSDAFYASQAEYQAVITAGTVGGVSVVGAVVACWSIENRSALRPTTAGRTLDVSAGGEAGVDWANVGSPTTTLNLSGTTVAAVSGAVGSVTGNVGGNVTGSVGSVVGAVGSVTGAVGSVTGAVGSVTGNVGGNVTGSVGSVVGAVGSVTGNVGGNVVGTVGTVNALANNAITAAAIATDAGTELATAVWDLADAIETGVTPRGAMRAQLATTAGVIADAATTTNTFKNPAGGTTRVTATVDTSGNRSAVTLNV